MHGWFETNCFDTISWSFLFPTWLAFRWESEVSWRMAFQLTSQCSNILRNESVTSEMRTIWWYSWSFQLFVGVTHEVQKDWGFSLVSFSVPFPVCSLSEQWGKASFYVSIRAVHSHPLRRTSCSRADQPDGLWYPVMPIDCHGDDVSSHPGQLSQGWCLPAL